MQFLWKYIDDLVGKGLEFAVMAELIFYLSATMVSLALPIAVLLASIMTFGKLGEHYELVALKSAGISLFRFMLPLTVASLFISGIAFLFANNVVPICNLKSTSLLYSVIKQRPAFNLKPGVYYDGIEGFVIRVGQKKAEAAEMVYDVKIHNHTENVGNNDMIVANKGQMFSSDVDSSLVFRLFEGIHYQELAHAPGAKERTYQMMRTEFEEYEMLFDLSGFGFSKADEGLFKSNHRMMSVRQLQRVCDSLSDKGMMLTKRMSSNMRPYFSFVRDTTFTIENLDMKKEYPKIVAEPKDSATIANKDTGRLKLPNKEKALAKTKEAEDTAISNKQAEKTPINWEEVKPKGYLAALQLPEKEREIILRKAKNSVRNVKSFARTNKDRLKVDEKKINRFTIELHYKIALALACFTLFLVGAPLGAIIRKGGLGMPMVVAILFFVVFHILSTSGKKAAEEFVLSPITGVWLATFILLPIGVLLTFAATTDSAWLSSESYKRVFRKIFLRRG